MKLTSPIRFPCPECGRRLRADRQDAGEECECGYCGAEVPVPARARVWPWVVAGVMGLAACLVWAVLLSVPAARQVFMTQEARERAEDARREDLNRRQEEDLRRRVRAVRDLLQRGWTV